MSSVDVWGNDDIIRSLNTDQGGHCRLGNFTSPSRYTEHKGATDGTLWLTKNKKSIVGTYYDSIKWLSSK